MNIPPSEVFQELSGARSLKLLWHFFDEEIATPRVSRLLTPDFRLA